jgi:hypothetical protein
MRKTLIAGIIALFAIFTTVGAPAMAEAEKGESAAWHIVAIGAGSLAGMWAVNLASGGLAFGTIGASIALGDFSGAMWTALVPRHAVLLLSGAVAGGYVGAWISE